MAGTGRQPRQIDRASPQWILTYADVATLLLVFFIFLFSASEISEARFQAATGSLRANMGLRPRRGSVVEPRVPAVHSRRQKRTDVRLGAPGESSFGADLLARPLGTRVVLGGSIMFADGSSELDEEAIATLSRIADEIRGLPNIVEVHGHAARGEGTAYAGGDELALSVNRAVTALRYLDGPGKIKDVRLRALGAGSQSPAGAGAYGDDPRRNRRVEIIVVREAVIRGEKAPDSAAEGR
jgi:chemotaxis protein MotB